MGLKTKLAMAVVTSAAGAAMLAGGTFAFFSASATNNANTFAAGNVAVQLDGQTTDTTNLFNISSGTFLLPGDSGKGPNATITNNGDVNEWVRVVNAEGQGSTQTGPNIFSTTLTDPGATTVDNNPLDVTYTITGTDATGKPIDITGDASSADSQAFELAPGATATIQYSYSWSSQAGNAYQGATGQLGVTVQAVQVDNNGTASGPSSWT